MIETYLVNLPYRIDRLKSSIENFRNKNIFRVFVKEPIYKEFPTHSLWETLKSIVLINKEKNNDYFLFCEDDLQFTEHFNETTFLKNIEICKNLGYKLLHGGVANSKIEYKISDELFVVSNFCSSHFLVIFKDLYDTILNYDFGKWDLVDLVLSKLAGETVVQYPFINIQKEFGYSDITPTNAIKGLINSIYQFEFKKFENFS